MSMNDIELQSKWNIEWHIEWHNLTDEEMNEFVNSIADFIDLDFLSDGLPRVLESSFEQLDRCQCHVLPLGFRGLKERKKTKETGCRLSQCNELCNEFNWVSPGAIVELVGRFSQLVSRIPHNSVLEENPKNMMSEPHHVVFHLLTLVFSTTRQSHELHVRETISSIEQSSAF